jgi:hypothetical protein
MRAQPTSVQALVSEGRLAVQPPDARILADILEEATRDIAAADANMADFGSWADTMIYEAGLRAVRVIVQSAGYRVVVRDRAHVTAIDAADALTGGTYHAVYTRLHRMRRRRNEFMYEGNVSVTESDMQQARQDASVLIGLARVAVSRVA